MYARFKYPYLRLKSSARSSYGLALPLIESIDCRRSKRPVLLPCSTVWITRHWRRRFTVKLPVRMVGGLMWSDNESTEDLLGFQYLADAVVSIVKNENLLPATIGVFGDWGGGKSTLIEIVRSQLT